VPPASGPLFVLAWEDEHELSPPPQAAASHADPADSRSAPRRVEPRQRPRIRDRRGLMSSSSSRSAPTSRGSRPCRWCRGWRCSRLPSRGSTGVSSLAQWYGGASSGVPAGHLPLGVRRQARARVGERLGALEPGRCRWRPSGGPSGRLKLTGCCAPSRTPAPPSHRFRGLRCSRRRSRRRR